MPDIRYRRATPRIMARKACAFAGNALRYLCCECGHTFSRATKNPSLVRCPRCHSHDTEIDS